MMPLSDKELLEIDTIENVNSRPSKESYYMALAFVVSARSLDPSSKCGCVIVSNDGRVLSTGYNGPLKDSKDEDIPLTRPQRYYHMIHAEENAILACAGSYQDFQGATAYVTGRPCHRCLRMLLQKGISTVIYGNNLTKVVDAEDVKSQYIMIYKTKTGTPRAKLIQRNDVLEDVVEILYNTIKNIKKDI